MRRRVLLMVKPIALRANGLPMMSRSSSVTSTSPSSMRIQIVLPMRIQIVLPPPPPLLPRLYLTDAPSLPWPHTHTHLGAQGGRGTLAIGWCNAKARERDSRYAGCVCPASASCPLSLRRCVLSGASRHRARYRTEQGVVAFLVTETVQVLFRCIFTLLSCQASSNT